MAHTSSNAFDEGRINEAAARPPVETGWVSTRLAGVFFLINALERLRFFDHLTDHFQVKSALGGWHWLTILARCFIPRHQRGLAYDPLWTALQSLEASEQTVPMFAGPGRYELPTAWLLDSSVPSFRIMATGGREQIWYLRGFPLADSIAGSEEPPVHARRLPRRIRRRLMLLTQLGSGTTGDPDLNRFLQFVVPFLRWRLRQALSLEPHEEIFDELLARDGEVAIASSHIDVRMPLEEVRLSVRLAGLDANPGFVPALGRVITFHFV